MIALVALDALDVLHEHGLGAVDVEEPAEVPVGLADDSVEERLLDSSRVLDAGCDDAETLPPLRRELALPLGMVEAQLDDAATSPSGDLLCWPTPFEGGTTTC